MKTMLHSFALIVLLTHFSLSIGQDSNMPYSNSRNSGNAHLVNSKIAETELDSFITQTMQTYHIPGLSAYFVNREGIIWSSNYGYANIEQNIKVSDSTLFKTASLSKPVTATALMQLWENGLFNLDDNINDYLPEKIQITNPNYPDRKITFRMLLSHTSGIDDDYNIIKSNLMSWGTDSPVSLDSFIVNYFMPGGSYYWMGPYRNTEPGAAYSYSNPGYALAGYLVEVIADTPFAAYCKKNIFKPLGMDNTGWFLSDINASSLATPYSYNAGYSPYRFYGWPIYPAGSLMSSVKEYSYFLRAFMRQGELDGRRILKSATVDSIWTIQATVSNSEYYGLGWVIDLYDTTLAYGHNGILPGCRTGMDCGPSVNQGAILFSNGESIQGVNDIWWKLYETDFDTTADIVESKDYLVSKFSLSQNYPNPFNPSTTIEFILPRSEYVELKVFNILGMGVSTLISKKLNQGNHTYTFEAKNLASGIYYYQLVAGDYRMVKKMILIR